jgi:hypothetical protein
LMNYNRFPLGLISLLEDQNIEENLELDPDAEDLWEN